MKDELRKIYHDLQSPITVLQGFLRASESELLKADLREIHETARVSLEKLKKIVGQLQELAKEE